MTNYILGFGISGAIAAFYLDEFKVISKPIKFSRFPLGPQYIYDTPETRSLFEDLEIPIKTRTVKAGYLVNGKIQPPNKEILSKYHYFIRGTLHDEKWLQEHLRWKFEVIDYPFADVVAKIYQVTADRIIEDEIISIDLEHKRLIGIFDEYEYKKLICTIPLPELSTLAGIKTKLRWKPIIVNLQNQKDVGVDIYSVDFDYVYLMGRQPYRITKLIEPYVVAEYTTKDVPRALCTKIIPYGKIIEGKAPDLSEFDVYLVGRFARWDKNYKVHDAIRDVKKLEEAL